MAPPSQPRTDLVGAEGAKKLNDLASEAIVTALSIVKEIRTARDVERNFPIFIQYMNEMLTCQEQMEDIISGLDRDDTLEVNRHILADKRQETSAKAIKVELKRLPGIWGVSRQAIAEIKAKNDQFAKRSAALSARVAANTQRHVPQSSGPVWDGPDSGPQTADMPPGFGSGPGGLGSTPDKSTSNPFDPDNAAADKSASNPFEPGNAAPDKSASNPFKPENAPSSTRSGAPGGFGSGPSGGFGSGHPPGLGGPRGSRDRGGRMGPDVHLETQDPDELVEIAKGGNEERRQAALRNLAAADPSKASKETKKAVCLALKTIAFEEQADQETRALAVEGMGLWAGRYAAPQLLQLLKHSGDGFFQRELHGTILRVLGELKHPDTLEPLVLGFADGSFDSDATAECLIQFGPEVEPLILKHCRPGNSRHSRRVVYILYKIGTPKSLPALRALSRSIDGPMLREEIIQAAEAIEKRRKTQAKE